MSRSMQEIRTKLNVAAREKSNQETFLSDLALIQSEIPSLSARLLPSSFNPSSPIFGYPRSLDWRWNWLCDALRVFKTPGVVVRLPLFFQLEPLIFQACREADAFPFINDRANMPVGLAALKEEGIGVVLTEMEDGLLFSQYLREKNFSKPIKWLIVSDTEIKFADFNLPGARSIHIIPGVPVLEECLTKPEIFHAADDFSLEEKGGRIFCTGLSEEFYPFFNYELPFRISPAPCVCGKEGFTLYA